MCSGWFQVNPFHSAQCVAFHIETSHLLCSAKHKTGFYIKRNTVLNWIKKGVPGKDKRSQWNHNKHNVINIIKSFKNSAVSNKTAIKTICQLSSKLSMKRQKPEIYLIMDPIIFFSLGFSKFLEFFIKS